MFPTSQSSVETIGIDSIEANPVETADLNAPLFTRPEPPPELPRIRGLRVEALLGRGSMGFVYEALDLQRGRRVALKVSAAATPEDLARVEAEAELQRQLHHPAIPRVLGSGGLPDGRGYLIQGLVRGARPFDRAVGDARRLEILGWGATAAEALAVAHGRCVIHGDVKPENLLVDAQGRLFLIDWGVARLESCAAPTPAQLSPQLEEHAERQASWVQGTLAYMAPEQLRGEPSQASDVYALGLVLLESLRGAHPFAALLVDANVLVQRILHGDPPAVPESWVVPLRDLLEGCLSKDPARRPSSLEVGQRLRQLVRNERRVCP